MSTSPCWNIFYHYVRDAHGANGQGIRALSPTDFQWQLDWLQERAEIIGYDAFERAVEEGRGFDRPSALLTFDDGLADHWQEVYPELRRRGLSGVFFLNGSSFDDPPALVNVHRIHLLLDELGAPTMRDEVRRILDHDPDADRQSSLYIYRDSGEPEQVVRKLLNFELPYHEVDPLLREMVRRHLGDEGEMASRFYLSRAQVREMAAGGMTFGYHTRRHRVMSRLDATAQREELASGLELVRRLTGQQSVPFSYPHGHPVTYNASTIQALDELGYAMAFTTVRKRARPGRDARFEIPRFDTTDIPPKGRVDIAIEEEVAS